MGGRNARTTIVQTREYTDGISKIIISNSYIFLSCIWFDSSLSNQCTVSTFSRKTSLLRHNKTWFLTPRRRTVYQQIIYMRVRNIKVLLNLTIYNQRNIFIGTVRYIRKGNRFHSLHRAIKFAESAWHNSFERIYTHATMFIWVIMIISEQVQICAILLHEY